VRAALARVAGIQPAGTLKDSGQLSPKVRGNCRCMDDLLDSHCTACRGGEPTLTDDEIRALLPQVPGWSVLIRDGVARLLRVFRFPDFRSAMAFAVQVGEVAEREGHHPDLHVAWGRVTVETWTHAIGGLHRNDFILAAKIGELTAESPPGDRVERERKPRGG
jgi:4a-hydroxytetrahydrobiopterin dehydratase